MQPRRGHCLSVLPLLLLSGCEPPEGITRVEADNGSVEHIVFDSKLEVRSPFDGKTYVAMPLSHFDTLGLSLGRKHIGGNLTDRKFSHARFAAVRKFPNCGSFREAAQAYDKSRNRAHEQLIKASAHPRTKQRYGAFYDKWEQYANVTGEPTLMAYSSPSYLDSDTYAEVDKCDARAATMSRTEMFQKRPYVVFWLYIEDDPASDRLNDVYLTKVTYSGFRDAKILKEWLRMMGDDIVQDAVDLAINPGG